jgi:hypothetical protein
MENVDPNVAKFQTLAELPNRPQDRIDIEEPKCMKLRTERPTLAIFGVPPMEMLLPNLAK